ncbi:hypothetical protein SLE2022_021990 [Rubroshorea leprosula]
MAHNSAAKLLVVPIIPREAAKPISIAIPENTSCNCSTEVSEDRAVPVKFDEGVGQSGPFKVLNPSNTVGTSTLRRPKFNSFVHN